MALDCDKKLEDPEETHQPHGESADSTHTATIDKHLLMRVCRRYGPGALGRWKTTNIKDLHTLLLTLLLNLIFTVWFITGVGASVSTDSQVISARLGDTVVLPCKVSEVSTQTRVYWKTDSQAVFERWGAMSFPGSGYEGRVDVPEEELCKGSCSLVLKNVSVTDAAVYMSYIKSGGTHVNRRSATSNWQFIQSVTLSVQEPNVMPDVRDDAQLDCANPLMLVFSLLLCLFNKPVQAFLLLQILHAVCTNLWSLYVGPICTLFIRILKPSKYKKKAKVH